MHAKKGLRIVKVVAPCANAPAVHHGAYGGFPVHQGDELTIHLSDGTTI